MINKNLLLFCLCFVIAILGHKTSIASKEELRGLNRTSIALKEEINKNSVLSTEWVYLNRSERLDKLATKHLNLTTIKPTQVVQFSNKNNSIIFANAGLVQKFAMNIIPSKKPKVLI